MTYEIRDSKRKHMIEAYDKNNNLVGEAVISPFTPSDIYEKPRLSIYIDITVKGAENEIEIKDQLFEEIIKRARKIKEANKDIDVKIYHCCFSDNKENIAYYSSKEGFKYDDGMYILKKDLTEETFEITEVEDIDFVKLELIDENEIKQLVEKQNKVFASGYSFEDLVKLKNESQWFSIAAKYNGEIVGNIIIVIKEKDSASKYAWVDDLFVSKEWRRHGIARALIIRALHKMKNIGIKESRLEAWSENERALSVYNNLGYKFYKETESSIGMFL